MNKISALTTPVEFDSGDFLSVLSLSAGTAIARQKKFGELIGNDNWNVDIRERTITFGNRVFEIGIIGSESEYSNTWLWGWAHTESGLPENAAAPSRRAKRSLPNCPEFTEGKFELDELHNGHNLSMTTIGVSAKNVCYYRCPYEGGALFVQIDGLPDEIFEPLSLNEIARQHVEIISSLYCSHKLLAAGLLHQNGYSFTDNGNNITCEYNNQLLKFDFENYGDIMQTSNISLNHL